MTVRLPVVGSDNGAWGALLNSFLQVSVNPADGTLLPSAVSAALSGGSVVTLSAGAPSLGKVAMAKSPSTYGWARQPVDWINAVNEYGADPTGTADSTTAINNALGAAVAGQVVYLPQGTYLVSAPIVIPAGVVLRGPFPVSPASGFSSADLYGAVLKATAGWTNGTISSSNNPGVVYVNGNGTTINRPGIENLWVDLRLAPATTHGVSVWGGCAHATLRNFGVMGPATSATSSGTGNLLVIAPDTSANQWTGGSIDSVALQNAVGHGVWFHGTTTQLTNVHASAYNNSTGSLAGIYLDSAVNCRLTMCRSDQSGDFGFVVDSGPSGPSPGSSVTLAACGTSGNNQGGLKVINSSTGGNTTARLPVTVIGCSFDSDGAQGGVNPVSGAGVLVQGVNVVNLIGCNVTTGGLKGSGNNHLYPEYALVTATPGIPQRIYARGGVWNCNSGPVSDGASANPIVEVGSVVGSAWTTSSTVAAYTLNLPGSGGGMTNPMNAANQIIYGGASGTPTALNPGTNGQVLGITAGAIGWVNNPAGFPSPMNTVGDMIMQGASGPARLGVGANGNYLGVVGGQPAWVTPPTATIILPSNDTSGVTDTKAIINAINGMTNGGVIQLGPGNFYITYVAGWSNNVTVAGGNYSGMTGIAVILPAQTAVGTHGGFPVSLQGSGAATAINVVGNCTGIYHHRYTSYGAQFANTADPSAGFIRDLVIDGTSATGTAVGLDVGDARGIFVENVTCQNFSGSGQVGCNIVNRFTWTEKCWFNIQFYNNQTACYMTTLVPSGDWSHEYNNYDFTLFANMNQQGIVCDGVNQGGSNLWLKGNMCQTSAPNGSAPTNNVAALSIINAAGVSSNSGKRWYMGSIWMKIEYNQSSQYFSTYPQTSYNVAPYGLYSDGTGYLKNCDGLIAHSLTPSNWNGAEFSFGGRISGDIPLAQLSPTAAGGTSSSAPAFPGFGTVMQNTGPDQLVCVSGGGTTGITVNGTATGLSSGAFFVPAGGSITVNGSGASPSYKWAGVAQMTY